MLKVSRREYKVMLEHRLFGDRKAAASVLCRELNAIARRLKKTGFDGEFEKTAKREITFLDTRDCTITLNRLLLRQRVDLEEGHTEYTLKCRSPDRYVAAGAPIQAGPGIEGKIKLEEDINAPFIVRFSHSNTVVGPAQAPRTLANAAEIFPALGHLERDGKDCPRDLDIEAVHSLTAYERVLTGPVFEFGNVRAEVALVLWSDGADGRPLVGEISFRYGHDHEGYTPQTAALAMRCFEEIQLLDWCRPDGRTKTRYAYRE